MSRAAEHDESQSAPLRAQCLRILQAGSLAAKLAPIAVPGPAALPGDAARDSELGPPGPALDIDAPAREAAIAFREETSPLPRPGALGDPAARAECLARFAHHELMAVELFAWALLRWPDLDPALRRDFARVIGEEQLHCRLYLQRLAAHGSDLSRHALSAYFWKQLPAIRASDAGPAAFIAAMGLTLEQANLDFTLVYRDAFRSGGDEASARVSQRVHDDEIGHVRLAASWLARLRPESDEVARYEACVPYPLQASRAKGRRFDVAARRAAGLSEAYIAHVRSARSSQERARERQTPSEP